MALDKTFNVTSPRDYFDKLHWEVKSLFENMYEVVDQIRVYKVMNAASTAWHLTDWVYPELTNEQRAGRTKGPSRGLTGYQTWLRHECGALHICRQIAIPAKHREITNHPDSKITTGMTMYSVPGTGRMRILLEPSIHIDGVYSSVENVLMAAEDFWRLELQTLGLWGPTDAARDGLPHF